MSDDLVKRLRGWPGPRGAEVSFQTTMSEAADLIETQAARIAELEAALATARREGMKEAAQIADSCAADWTKSAKGKYLETKWDYESRADAGEEIAAAIRAALEGRRDDPAA